MGMEMMEMKMMEVMEMIEMEMLEMMEMDFLASPPYGDFGRYAWWDAKDWAVL